MDWNTIWTAICDFVVNSGPRILLAIITFVAGMILIKIVIKLLNRWFKKTNIDPTTRGFLNSAIKILLYVLLVLLILQELGIPITGFAAVLTTAGVAVALALKDSLSNVAYGMILVTSRPFKQGDYVKIGNVEGTVRSIEIMATEIISIDNKLITIPNKIVYSSAMINYTGLKKRRMDMYFTVAYNTDIEKVRKIAKAVCHSNGFILTEPAPEVHIHNYDGSNITLFMTCWSVGKYWDIYYYLMDNMYNELARNGIVANYNQLQVRIKDSDEEITFIKKPLPKRVEPKTSEVEEFNLFDIETYNDIGDKLKKRKLKKLRRQRALLDKELRDMERSMPYAKMQSLITTNSIMLKKHKKLIKIKQKINFKQNIQDKKSK